MDIIKLLRNGLLSIGDSYVDQRDYVVFQRGGFRIDQENLAADVRTVGKNMKKTIGRHGKQPYETSRS